MKWIVRFSHPQLIDDQITVERDSVTLKSAPRIIQEEYLKQGISLDDIHDIKVTWVVPK